jgi:2-keto-4-pentenoate hydratase/2-oxohepta-3-ene-1,7-dioic acid hydratase in catechol pathway
MKIARYYDSEKNIRLGSLSEDGFAQRLCGELFSELKPEEYKEKPEKLLAPLLPAAIFCIGLNYRSHAREMGAPIPEYPVIFMKAPNTLQNALDPIFIPVAQKSDEVDYEGELAVIIGKTCKNVKRAEALKYVFGYACANDVSARDWQRQRSGGQWIRSKNFDSFCPLGPCIVTAAEISNPDNLAIRTFVNGDLVQNANTSDMIFDIASLIEFLSASTTLYAGTVILTGTPSGIGMSANPPRWLRPGDTVSVEIEKIGTLTNAVAMEK